MYQRTTLDNGLKLISHSMPQRDSAAVGIWVKTGSRYEEPAHKGVSHYLEHLLFKGSRKYSCRQLKEAIEGVGGSLNGFTSEELTCYFAKVPGGYLEKALDVLSDMVLNPLLPPQEVEKERTVILEEIKMYRDLPQSYVYELLDELLWPNQPLGTSVIGSFETVGSISRDDLRNYQQENYRPLNIVVSVCGRINHQRLLRQLRATFRKSPAAQANKFAAARENQARPQLKLLPKDTEQTHLALGFHSLKREHPLRHALALLHIILGGNMSSRLFEQVREKRGLAYEIGTQLKRYQDTGAFLVHAGMDNRKTEQTIRLVLKELYKTKKSLVSKDEFRRAKEFYLGQLSLSLEDSLDYMFWLGEAVATLDKTYTFKEIAREVSKLRPGDLREAASRVFRKEALNVALIGPLKAQENNLQAAIGIK